MKSEGHEDNEVQLKEREQDFPIVTHGGGRNPSEVATPNHSKIAHLHSSRELGIINHLRNTYVYCLAINFTASAEIQE
jgi:hypothetical protein